MLSLFRISKNGKNKRLAYKKYVQPLAFIVEVLPAY